MISLAVLMTVTYFAFVYFSNMVNPFSKPRMPARRSSWRYGRRMALAVLTGGCLMLVLMTSIGLPFTLALAVGVSIAVILGLCFSIDRIRTVLQGE